MRKPFRIVAQDFLGGYHSQPRYRKPNELSSPSVNARIGKDGMASTRPGYDDTGIDLASSGKAASPFHMTRFPLSFFAVGTKIYYVVDGTTTKVDTGITQTDGTTTRFAEFLGDVYAINTTDGVKRILVTTLAASVSLGGDVAVAIDGAVRTDTLSTGTILVNGTSESYGAVNKTTGVLDTTASQAYTYSASSPTYCIITQTLSSLPKGSKIAFWKECMYIIGVQSNASYDVPSHTLFFGEFATGTAFEKIFSFSGGLSGTELVGTTGKITNIVATNDNLYVFKEDVTYRIGVGDVNISTGARPPQILSSQFGCVNEDCAVDMGGFMVWLTKNKRVMRSNVRVQDGQSVLYADESFDSDIRDLLEVILDDQSDAHMEYWNAGKHLFLEVNADRRLTLVHNNEIGKWGPPDTNKALKKYFQIGAYLYATDKNDDTIFQVETGTSDNGADIECVIAGGIMLFEDGRVTCDWQALEVSGGISSPCLLDFEGKVNGADGTVKTITSEGFSADSSSILVGAIPIGGDSSADEYLDFDKRLAIYPSKGGDFQWIFSSYGDNHRFRIDSVKVEAAAYSKSLLTTV